jgi:glycosyltransferase involved in cell wall biosynthesis
MSLPVSVQVCTLNEAANIRECLETIAANDPAEIVVIDGGSTDDTISIAREFGARLIEPGRLGLGPSRRLGYMSSETTYTAFVDADDRLDTTWLSTMIRELEAGSYSALQSCLRVPNTGNWWSKGWNQYFIESVRPTADTNMVGRPALFVTADLQADETEFASLDEDTHMSRAFELRGLRQGIGTAIAYRYCEETRDENFKKWKSYGRGYRGFVDDNPERRHAILKHMLVTVPLVRGWRPALRGHLTQPVFAGMMAANIYSGWRSAKK